MAYLQSLHLSPKHLQHQVVLTPTNEKNPKSNQKMSSTILMAHNLVMGKY